ncbi:MAG: glutamate-5-semialdehyde dehydrogenase [Verrucomicrobiales bacterium]|nr:glutamate-5-semialdehyde dehydrogenase [Verrucomicrobiales bacterium]
MSKNSEDIKAEVLKMGAQARAAARALTKLSSEKKNEILRAMADSVMANEAAILEANEKDLAAADELGLTAAMKDRLRLDSERLAAIAGGIREVADLHDPTGEIIREWDRPNGLRIQKKRTPIGVIGIIFESRPNVTSDAAVLCFKTGNATILRGGKEAIHSNLALAAALQEGGAPAGLPDHSIQLIPFTDRESVRYMAEMDKYLDLIIPRGGAGLIEAVVSMARMPVIKHYDGICHVYVDKQADLDMAEDITVNSKIQKPSVCNALETLLIHKDIAPQFAPRIAQNLSAKNVELRGDEKFRELCGIDSVKEATDADWTEEYLDYILAVKVVDDLDAAISHINHYGSHHTESIVTGDEAAAEKFQLECDSATVFWNASTRFSDGGEFGFGAEIGISTDKLHARGPMALEELTSYKYLVFGDGQLRG